MRKIFPYIIFICLLYSNKLHAQQTKIDSLQKLLLIAKEDTGKVNILNNLAMEFRNNNPDTSIYYAKEAKKLSKKLDYIAGIAEAHLWWATSLTVLGKYEEAFNQMAAATTLSEHLIQISKTGNKKNKSILSRIYNNTAILYSYKSDYSEALKCNYKALKVRKEIDDQKGMASSYNNIGVLYADRGSFPEALKNYFLALRIYEKINDKKNSGTSYVNIGNVYYNQKNFNEAVKNYSIALTNFKENGSLNWAADCYNNLGEIYIQQKKYTEALEISQKALQIFIEIGSKDGIANSKLVIGNIKNYQKLYLDALKNYKEADEIFEEIGRVTGIISAKINIAETYNQMGNFKNALDYGKKGLLLSKENGILFNQRDAYLVLFQVYKKLDKYKEALEMHELYIQTRDSVINEKNQKDIMSQQFKFDYDKKSLADSLNFASQKNLSDLKNKAEHKIEQNKRYALYAGLFLALIFSIFIFNRFRITTRQKKVIEFQNDQIVESINYSKQIQASLLPSISVMQKSLSNLFVLFEPKAIVSGDFYWFKDFEKYTILACVDCTGHGVPGGFMSTLGSLLLDKVVNYDRLNPSEILSNLSNEIISVLHQQAGGAIQDGMDLSICLIDKEHHTVEFAGARNGIIVVTNGVAKKYKADLFPVGGSYLKKGKEIDRIFKTQTIALEKNDWIYMYTDGFMEQSGGEQNLPMNYGQFENHLIAISNQLSPEEKTQKLKQELDAWRGTNERDDDVLVMGFQVN